MFICKEQIEQKKEEPKRMKRGIWTDEHLGLQCKAFFISYLHGLGYFFVEELPTRHLERNNMQKAINDQASSQRKENKK